MASREDLPKVDHQVGATTEPSEERRPFGFIVRISFFALLLLIMALVSLFRDTPASSWRYLTYCLFLAGLALLMLVAWRRDLARRRRMDRHQL